MRKQSGSAIPKAGRIRRFIRRHKTSPWVLSLAGTAILALVLLATSPGLLPLVLLPLGAVLGAAGDRLREHWGWHRKGGKAALRKRRRYQGHATFGELGRNLPAGQGVPIGTVRRASW
jgi:hypothetical protein